MSAEDFANQDTRRLRSASRATLNAAAALLLSWLEEKAKANGDEETNSYSKMPTDDQMNDEL